MSTPNTAAVLVPGGDAGNRFHRRFLTHPWAGFTYRRLGGLILSFLTLTLITFIIVPLIPGDPAVVAAGDGATTDQIERIRTELGLDLPGYVQLWNYFTGILRLDMGTSFISGESVSTIIFNRFPYTATIALLAIGTVLVVSVPLGMLVANLTRGGRMRWLDNSFTFVTSIFYALPQYVMATFLVVVFAVTFRVLPAAGAASPESLILPTAALAIGPISIISRIVRRETAVALEKDFVRTARGWRLSGLRLQLKYVLPNLLTTTLTLSGLILAGQLGGAVVIETVFGWPGLGLGIVNAIVQRDYPVIRGIILVLGLLATLIIALVDTILAVVDPRNLEA